MNDQNTAFEKWWGNRHRETLAYEEAKSAWQAAKQHYEETWLIENEKKILILESEVAELKERLETHIAINKSLLLQRDELQANNHDLREALEELVEWIELGESESGFLDKSRKALSTTPAESLKAFEDDVIEKCAKVCDDDAKQSREFAEPFAAKCAELLAESIRALKGN